ncbi:MAG: DUF120 domain-containing protein [Clostridia bacterium]|jgi:riboflavin kinase|nr:CTP-dependent riboflavin kinase [Clostridia bacterium]MDH7572104.1 DUF120 domain-containing protein [Clostridia bacterium]
MRVKGRYCRGRGEAAAFTRLEWVQEQCREKLGFNPRPGTVNLRVKAGDLARLRQVAEARGVVLASPCREYCDAFCLPARLGRAGTFVEGALVFPRVGDYYTDMIEFLCPVEVKSRFELQEEEEMELIIIRPDANAGD